MPRYGRSVFPAPHRGLFRPGDTSAGKSWWGRGAGDLRARRPPRSIPAPKVDEIHVNGINHTFTFETQGNGNSKLTVGDAETTPSNVTVFFVSTSDIQFATFGRSLEGDFVNNFTKDEFDRVQGLAEHYNLDRSNIENIINFTTIDQQKAYEIAGKMKLELGFITPDANLTKAGQAYIDGIGNSTSFAEIFDKIEERIRAELGSNGTGDNPDFPDQPSGQ